jgi:protein-disulfide isomerase
LPLSQIHPNAFAGARAAEAASLQNKFWEMHDMLYENQNTWSQASNPKDYFNQYAEQLGLNVEQFKTDFASTKVNSSINADLAAFKKTGAATETPTFFLDGKRIDTKADAETFSKLLDAAIESKKSEQ